jgi:hypothetical protein
MSVIRVNKTKNYTVMSNHHFKEKKMSLKAKGLLSICLSLPNDWNYSVSGLVTLSKDGKDSVMSALAELEKFGYLYREQLVNEKGQFAGIEYHIFEEPQKEYPISENPISDNQNKGKQISENQSLLNTKLTKNLNNKIIYNINNYINLLDTVSDSQLRNLYVSFLENRNAMGVPMTVKGFEMLIDRVRELAGLDIDRQRDLVRNAVINNWKNVYAKNEQPTENPTINQLREFYE